ncbi:archaetidylserine decarboxylase [Desulforamulus ruminis]|uniref:archaetidylserine decarboxylase n=1 Tax=Desulforamulus ruminis TaxID=1564 RepID=UPI002354DF64|nr:archaetidylserine decarboxylase [Desulforamulus ruminis]
MKILKKAMVHALSRESLGKIFQWACGSRYSRKLIRPYIRLYQVNPAEIKHPDQYKSLADFFSRDICPSLRPVDPEKDAVVSPVDGKIADLGFAREDQLILAKNNSYSISQLLGQSAADDFREGYYFNIYLSPKNYHRIHMPFGAKVIKHKIIPGKVFPVNDLGAATIKDLFARNKRTCTFFETPGGLKFALVKVGALGVGQIVSHFTEGQWIDKGAEIGRFEFGSTVILLFQREIFKPVESMLSGQEIKMGQRIGTMIY